MTNYPADQVCSPPELPPFLRNVYNLNTIVGVPKDEEMMGIHAVVRMAHRFTDVPDICSPVLLHQLSEHLFDAQMAKYRGRYPCSIFPMNTTYTPPALPAHASPNLEPVSGTPSDEAVIKVQDALRFYQRFADIPTMFDPQVNADLSRHLFDLQMEKYMRRCSSAQGDVAPRQPLVEPSNLTTTGQIDAQANTGTNNTGTGADEVQASRHTQNPEDAGVRDAIERPNRLAERANQLVERSNESVERANQLIERPNQPAEQPVARSDRLNWHSGYFYQCVNGHPYVIGEVMQHSTCPECGVGIGGSYHTIDSGNRHTRELTETVQEARAQGWGWGRRELPPR
ncbi:hypothetical protein RSOL_282750, partial [Rhizoctonia solani AG-3 Rhs1AP]